MSDGRGGTGSSNRPWLFVINKFFRRAIYSYLWLQQYYPQDETKQSDSRLSDKMFETLLVLKANALCGLNPALLGGYPKCRIPPSTSPLPCSEDHHLPLPD